MFDSISIADLARATGGRAERGDFFVADGLNKMEGGTGGVPVTTRPEALTAGVASGTWTRS